MVTTSKKAKINPDAKALRMLDALRDIYKVLKNGPVHYMELDEKKIFKKHGCNTNSGIILRKNGLVTYSNMAARDMNRTVKWTAEIEPNIEMARKTVQVLAEYVSASNFKNRHGYEKGSEPIAKQETKVVPIFLEKGDLTTEQFNIKMMLGYLQTKVNDLILNDKQLELPQKLKLYKMNELHLDVMVINGIIDKEKCKEGGFEYFFEHKGEITDELCRVIQSDYEKAKKLLELRKEPLKKKSDGVHLVVKLIKNGETYETVSRLLEEDKADLKKAVLTYLTESL